MKRSLHLVDKSRRDREVFMSVHKILADFTGQLLQDMVEGGVGFGGGHIVDTRVSPENDVAIIARWDHSDEVYTEILGDDYGNGVVVVDSRPFLVVLSRSSREEC